MTEQVTLADIVAARELLEDVTVTTPMEESRWLSKIADGPVLLKAENLQRAGSFKIRGAYTRMCRLSEEERANGVVAASAGNHAQGVALAGQLLGIDVKVYMPVRAPMPWTSIRNLRVAVTRGSFCRNDPAAVLRGLANGALPASTRDALSSSKAVTGK